MLILGLGDLEISHLLIKSRDIEIRNCIVMDNDQQEDKPPILKRWSYWYALVIGFLLLLIGFFYLFTKHFS